MKVFRSRDPAQSAARSNSVQAACVILRRLRVEPNPWLADFPPRGTVKPERRTAVPEVVDLSAPSLQGSLPKKAQELPHGLLIPPPEVLAQAAELDARLQREHGFRMTDEARRREVEEQ